MRYWSKWYVPLHTLSIILTSTILLYTLDDTQRDKFSLPMPLIANTEWYRFFSCQLVHINAQHLFNNIAILSSLGVIFELIHGPLPAFGIFWIGGTTGTLFEAGWWSSSSVNLYGASSGAYALVGAYLSHLIMNWRETPLHTIWLMLFVLTFAISVIVYVYDQSNTNSNVAHIAHTTGFVQGILVGNLTVRNVKVTRLEIIIGMFSFFLASSLIASSWYRVVI